MNILEELKLSKKQNNDKRYDYLCKQFNAVDYAMKLEKYTIKLQQENKKLNGAIQTYDILLKANTDENKQLKDNWNILKECLKDVMNSSNGDDKDFVETILNIIQELEQGSDSNVKD